MTTAQPRSRFRRILRKALILLSGLLALVLIILCLTLVFLPRMASSDWARREIVRQLEETLNRPVRIETLQWRWSKGITVGGVSIANPPAFPKGRFIQLSRMHLAIDYSRLFSRCLSFSLVIDKPVIHFIQNADGRLNLPAAAKKPAKPTEPPSAGPLSLPLDVDADIHIKNLAAAFDGHAGGRRLDVQKGDIRLKTASLVEAPLSLAAAAEIRVNGHALPPALIKARVNNLFSRNRRLQIQKTAAEIAAELPGTRVNINGDMASRGIKGDIRVNLEAVADAAAPFMPKKLQNSRISGRIALNLDMHQAEAGTLQFDTRLTGDELTAAGPILRGKAIGPGFLGIHAAGEMDPAQMDLQIDKGRIRLLKNSRLDFSGRFTKLDSGSPELDLTISPLEIDISEITAFGRPFIPRTLSLGSAADYRAECIIRKIHLKSALPNGRADIALHGLLLSAPDLKYQPGKPSREGPKQSIAVKGLHIEMANLTADKLKISDKGPFGITGKLRLTEAAQFNTLDARHIPEANAGLGLSNLRQELEVDLQLNPDGRIEATLKQMDIHAPDINFTHPDYKELATGAVIQTALGRLCVNPDKVMEADLKGLEAHVRLGGGLHPDLKLDLHADAREGGKTALAANAALSLDLARILHTFAIKAPPDLQAAGTAALDIKLSGKRPDPHTVQKTITDLKALSLPDHLDFLDHCRLRLSLADGSLDYRPEDGAPVRIKALSADPLLAYRIDGKSMAGELESRIRVSGATDLFLLSAESPASGTFSTQLQHTGIGRISGRQSITLSPGAIRQFLKFRLELPEEEIQAVNLKNLLAALTGQVTAGFKMEKSSELQQLQLPGTGPLEIEGAFGTDMVLEKRPDHTASVNISLNASDLSASLAPGTSDAFSLTKLNSLIHLSKTLELDWNKTRPEPERQSAWLSEELLRTDQDGQGFESALRSPSPFHALSDRLGASTGAARAISFQSAKLDAGGIPLALGPSHASLGLHRGLPQIPSIQVELMGGTLIGDCYIQQVNNGSYRLQTRFNFTGINAAALFPEAAGDIQAGASEISGSLFADIPLTPNMDRMLENAQIRINLRQIGVRALERLLYSLDPYETNEAIVRQRRLLQNSTPRRIEIAIKDGFLSLKGEVEVRSIKLAIPPLQRLNIAAIPGIKAYESRLAVIRTIIRALDLAASERLYVESLLDKNETIRTNP